MTSAKVADVLLAEADPYGSGVARRLFGDLACRIGVLAGRLDERSIFSGGRGETLTTTLSGLARTAAEVPLYACAL